MTVYRKFLGDSPDAISHTAELSSAHRYEITGNIAGAEYLDFTLYGTRLNGWNRVAAHFSNEALRMDASGNFTIILSKARRCDADLDWLQMEDGIHRVTVRRCTLLGCFTAESLDAVSGSRP